MKFFIFIALFWCVPVGSGYAMGQVSPTINELTRYSQDLVKYAARYLSSHLEFSDRSTEARDETAVRFTMSEAHDVAVNYQDSASRRQEDESKSLELDYSLAMAGGRFHLSLGGSEYSTVVLGDEDRFDTESDNRTLSFSGARPVGAWRGIDVETAFQYSTFTSRNYRESAWVSDTSHELANFGVYCSSEQALKGGFVWQGDLGVLGGIENREFSGLDEESLTDTEYYKINLAASLRRSVFDWNFGLDGRYQIAPDDLASSEYVVLAGPSMMQGFNGQSMSANEGGWIRMKARSPAYASLFGNAVNSYLVVSFLKGWAASEATRDGPRFEASAGEVALRFRGRRFYADLSVGRVLTVSGAALQRPSNPDISLSMSLGI